MYISEFIATQFTILVLIIVGLETVVSFYFSLRGANEVARTSNVDMVRVEQRVRYTECK